MKAVIYVRVSTAGQVNEGVSIEAQEAKARSWAIQNGYEVIGVHIDAGLSGKRAENRPALQEALNAVCHKEHCLIVYSLSRLARSTKDAITIAERLQKAGADLVSLSERIETVSAAGKMVFRMLAVLSEFERDLVSERTKAALMHKASKGERIGQIPYGYRLAENGVDLVTDEWEQEIRRELQSLNASGRSWREIADEFNNRGIQTKKGRPWTWQTARKAAA